MTSFLSSVPIIPARETDAAAAWYRDELGYAIHHVEHEYAIVGRDASWIHFWGPSGIAPERSMTMLRVGVDGIDELYRQCRDRSIVHPNAPLETKPWGLREFAVRDLDGNLVTFFEPTGEGA